MKLFFMSDIHGSFHYLKKALDAFEKENADYIVILGDILYHGARNPIPPSYNPVDVTNMLNRYASKIIAVKGNCDSEVDEMVLHFPIKAVYSAILHNNKRIFLTHGHIYNRDNIPSLSTGDILIHGHTHIPSIEKKDNIFIINPGSITFPKENSPNSYGILEENLLSIKDLDGNLFKQTKL